MLRRFLAITVIALASIVSSNGQDRVTFQCQDLKDAGVVLVPVSSPDYEPLLKDIQQRMDHPAPEAATIPQWIRQFVVGTISPEKRPTSAILLNRSEKSIAAMELVWRYEEVGGRIWTRSSAMPSGKRVLLPFGAPASSLKLQSYWSTILPGSKRYIGEDEMAGDNTDVRLPAGDEIWNGGGGGGGGGSSRTSAPPVKSVTLTVDGVFFTHGEFVGPGQFGLWESITSEAKMRMEVAGAARDGKASGIPAADVLDEIAKITGPSLLPRAAETSWSLRQTIASEIQTQRDLVGDARTVDLLAAQADTQLPDFRKR